MKTDKRTGKRIDISYIVIVAVLLIWFVIIIYPFYNAILISLVSSTDYIKNPFMLIPPKLSFTSYAQLLRGPAVWVGLKNTFMILLFGLPLNLLLTSSMAYAFSRKHFPLKKTLFVLVVFTMFFSGGMVPTFLVVKSLGLINKLASIVLLYGINTFYMILAKSYFESIPESVEESATIEGANDVTILFKIMLPLAKPILATTALFYLVDRWNEWFYSTLFIMSGNTMPLQVIVRRIVVFTVNEFIQSGYALDEFIFAPGIKMAAIIISMVPIMFVYPFMQRYFTKGIMIGAIKG